jgi:aryl-alcohol dehydrogenase-like predicted oxidoreductase
MRKRAFGTTGYDVSVLGVGAWAMGGGGWAFAWGPQDDRDSIAAIHAALDAGFNWIDTAAVYGLGHSESVVARALEGIAERPYVFTKCGRVWGADRQIGRCLRADSIRAECEASLRRLKVDCIDLYQIHWPEPDEEIEEGWQTLVDLRCQGKVRAIGVSNFSVAQLERIGKIAPVQTLQPPLSLVHREAEPVVDFAGKLAMGVIPYSPMRSGLLSGKMTRERIAALPEDDFRKRNPDFQEPALSRHLKIADALGEIGARQNATAGAAAIAWVLANPAVTGAIVGIRNPQQLDDLLKAAELRLAPDDFRRLDRLSQA